MPVFYFPVPAWALAQGVAADGQLSYAALQMHHQPAQNPCTHWAADGLLEGHNLFTEPMGDRHINEDGHKQSRLTVMDYTPV